MRCFGRIRSVVVLAAIVTVSMGAPVEQGKGTRPDRTGDTAAIEKSIHSYVKAFNRGDADAVAGHWAKDAYWISPDGKRIEGRDAIRKEMKAYFQETGRPRLEVANTKIHFLSPTSAVEEGSVQVFRPGQDPFEADYVANHVKQNNGWRLKSVLETANDLPPPDEHLDPLGWMVGTWRDRDGDTTIDVTCDWARNRRFLTRSFKVVTGGEEVMTGTQVIGWDPASRQIRSWLFDSEGSFGEGSWRQEGDTWIVMKKQILRDGASASSTNVLTRDGDGAMTWQSTNREVAGQPQPNLGPVTIRRQ